VHVEVVMLAMMVPYTWWFWAWS